MKKWVALIFIAMIAGLLIFSNRLIDFLAVEAHDVGKGNYHGLSIGSNKGQVLEEIKLINESAVIFAIPHDDYVISSKNLDDLYKMRSSRGVSVMNYKGFAINIMFENARVSKLFYSVSAQQTQYFKLNETALDVGDKLEMILTQHPDYVVIPLIDDAGKLGVPLKELTSEHEKFIDSYDAWAFYDLKAKPLGAKYELYFSNGYLERIIYRRPRVRWE
jgi:hypothetical protein